MSKVTELKKRVEEYQTAEITAGALQDISALKASAIRRQFEKNRAFYKEITELYGIIQSQAKSTAAAEKPKRPRVLYVAITSNKRFYGSLIRDVIAKLVTKFGQAPEASCLIVGRVGWQYFEQWGSPARARQMIIEDDVPTPQELEMLISHFESFDQILVFYPQFINSFQQSVGELDITQSLAVEAELQVSREKVAVGYIFEPEIPAILAFFDTQVRRVLFDRVLLESELARTSARLVRMSEAQERAHHLVYLEEAHMRREAATIANMGLLETFSGFSLWKRT